MGSSYELEQKEKELTVLKTTVFKSQFANLRKDDVILHITHTDLDGVGCSVVLREYYKDTAEKPHIATRFVSDYDRVLDAVKSEISHLNVTSMANKYPNKASLVILITDHNPFSKCDDYVANQMMDFMKSDEVSKNVMSMIDSGRFDDVTMIILDHHRTNFLIGLNDVIESPNDSARLERYNGHAVLASAYKGMRRLAGTEENGDFVSICTLMLTDVNNSATFLLSEILQNVDDKVKNFAYEVSQHDTGNFGHWWANDHDDFHNLTSDSEKLNYVFEDYMRRGVTEPYWFEQFIHDVRSLIDKNEDINDIYRKVCVNTMFGSIAMANALRATQRYDHTIRNVEWYDLTSESGCVVPYHIHEKGNPETVARSTLDDMIHADPISKNIVLKSDGLEGRIVHVAVIRSFTLDECNFPFSLYSQKFLTENSDIDIIMHIRPMADNPLKIEMSMRCYKDDIDISKFARANGGGGHLRAAGITITN